MVRTTINRKQQLLSLLILGLIYPLNIIDRFKSRYPTHYDTINNIMIDYKNDIIKEPSSYDLDKKTKFADTIIYYGIPRMRKCIQFLETKKTFYT